MPSVIVKTIKHWRLIKIQFLTIKRPRLFCFVYNVDNKLFMQKRKEQMYAAQNVWEMEDYSKKYSMIEKLLEAMFPVNEFSFEFL